MGATLGAFGLSKFVKAEEKTEAAFNYAKFFRNCDVVTMDEFRNMVCVDDNGDAWKVPIIWANYERTERFLKTSGIRLPLINLYRGDVFFAGKIMAYYHLNIHCYYEEHMNQIFEQAVIKFHPKLKSKVGEYSLMSMFNNYYPGGSKACVHPDTAMRGDVFSAKKYAKQGEWVLYQKEVLKHQLNLLLEIESKP